MKVLYISTFLMTYIAYPIVKIAEQNGNDYFAYFTQNLYAMMRSKHYRKMWDIEKHSILPEKSKFKIIKIFRLPKRLFNSLFIHLVFKIIYHEIKDKKFDIIHAHVIDPNAIIAYKLSQKLKIPYIVTEHGPEWYNNMIPTQKQKQKIIKKLSNAVENAFTIISVSEQFTEFLHSYWAKANIITSHNSFNSYIFTPPHEKDNLQEPQKKHVQLITVGSFCTRKNHILLLKAMNTLKKTYPNLRLTIVGEGELKPEYQSFISKNELENIVTIKDFMPHHELVREYYESDIFVLSSLKETFGIVLVEAMACGVNVIGSQTDGASAIINDGINGLVYNNNDLDDLCKKIQFLLDNPHKRVEFKEQGFLKAKEYDNKHNEVYQIYLKAIMV